MLKYLTDNNHRRDQGPFGGGGPPGAGDPFGSGSEFITDPLHCSSCPTASPASDLEDHLDPDNGGDEPGGGDGENGGTTPYDEYPPGKRPGHPGFPPDDGDKIRDGPLGQSRKPVSINKWSMGHCLSLDLRAQIIGQIVRRSRDVKRTCFKAL